MIAAKNHVWIAGVELQLPEDSAAQLQGRLQRGLLTAELTVRKVLGELTAIAADTEPPPLERCAFIRITCDVSNLHVGTGENPGTTMKLHRNEVKKRYAVKGDTPGT